jgi:hypothetical protein
MRKAEGSLFLKET